MPAFKSIKELQEQTKSALAKKKAENDTRLNAVRQQAYDLIEEASQKGLYEVGLDEETFSEIRPALAENYTIRGLKGFDFVVSWQPDCD